MGYVKSDFAFKWFYYKLYLSSRKCGETQNIREFTGSWQRDTYVQIHGMKVLTIKNDIRSTLIRCFFPSSTWISDIHEEHLLCIFSFNKGINRLSQKHTKLGRHHLQHLMVTCLENAAVENVNILKSYWREGGFLDMYTKRWLYYIFSAGLKVWGRSVAVNFTAQFVNEPF